MRRRAKFRPAASNGNPVYGIYRTSISWWVGEGYPPSSPELPEIVLTVSALPPRVKPPATLRLKFAVDEAGRASECAAEDKNADENLVQLGCNELLKSYAAQPAKTAENVSVASIQTATVLFKTN